METHEPDEAKVYNEYQWKLPAEGPSENQQRHKQYTTVVSAHKQVDNSWLIHS
jgi:hypothetical protein